MKQRCSLNQHRQLAFKHKKLKRTERKKQIKLEIMHSISSRKRFVHNKIFMLKKLFRKTMNHSNSKTLNLNV
jgi:hypothetical protein